MSTRRF